MVCLNEKLKRTENYAKLPEIRVGNVWKIEGIRKMKS